MQLGEIFNLEQASVVYALNGVRNNYAVLELHLFAYTIYVPVCTGWGKDPHDPHPIPLLDGKGAASRECRTFAQKEDAIAYLQAENETELQFFEETE